MIPVVLCAVLLALFILTSCTLLIALWALHCNVNWHKKYSFLCDHTQNPKQKGWVNKSSCPASFHKENLALLNLLWSSAPCVITLHLAQAQYVCLTPALLEEVCFGAAQLLKAKLWNEEQIRQHNWILPSSQKSIAVLHNWWIQDCEMAVAE